MQRDALTFALPRRSSTVGAACRQDRRRKLIVIGVTVVIGAVLLWPSQQKADIPLPFQNAAGGAVTTEAGYVLSSSVATCGSPSVGAVLTADPVISLPVRHHPRARR